MLKLPVARLCFAVFLLLGTLRPAAAADDPGEALRRAASTGDLTRVKELLAAGADINAANSYGGTALAFAADKGQTAVVELLLERGADPNLKDRFYNATPLVWAVQRGHADIARALLAKGAQGETEALTMAAAAGHAGVVKVILDRGKVGGETLTEALMAATQAEEKEVVSLLTAAGAKPVVAAVVDPAVLKSYEGTYDGEGVSLLVTLKEGKLSAGVEGGPTFSLSAIDPQSFRVDEIPHLRFRFQVEGGKVSGMMLDQGEKATPLKKRETK